MLRTHVWRLFVSGTANWRRLIDAGGMLTDLSSEENKDNEDEIEEGEWLLNILVFSS